MTRVLIVDDQSAFRHQLRLLLMYAGFEVVGEVEDIPTAERLVATLRPEIAIVDMMLPAIDGLDGTRRLKLIDPSLRVIVISAYRDHAEVYRTAARQAGAEAFVAKDELDVNLARTWLV